MNKNESRIIVLTGVTKGLGRAMAEKLIELGHTVWGCGRAKTEIARLKRRYTEPHVFDVVDVSSDAKVKKWATKLIKKFGAPDLILNCAGIINKNSPLWKISDKDFSSVIDINIKGVTNIIRHFVPAMVRRKKGVILNFSSGWGKFTAPDVAPYCATKFAIEGLTLALAQELPKGMAAIPLSPGIIHTEMLESCFGKSGANQYALPKKWAEKAVPYILKISPKQNGKSLEIP